MYNTLRIKRNICFVAVLLLLSIFQSCLSNSTRNIYKKSRKWIFNVGFYAPNGKLIDSCPLTMEVKSVSSDSSISDYRNITYAFTFDNCSGQPLYATTSISESNGEVSIPSPELGNLAFTTLLPSPSVSSPLITGVSSDIKIDVYKSEYTPASGKRLTQNREIDGNKQFTFNGKTIDCSVIKGRNTNYLKELGQYQCEFLFNDTYGFVSFFYKKPDGETVKIDLRKTNF